MKKLFVFTALALFSACAKEETVIDTSKKENVLKVIQTEAALQSLNSVAFAVVKNNDLLWADAVGYADKANGRAATINTRYLIASISKSVTAVAAMQLHEQNKLNLDADISTYLPFVVRNPRFADKPITTRMLLNHSSSISDAHYSTYDFYCWNEDCATPLGVFLEDFFNPGKQFYSPNSFYTYAPGQQANYTNMGYALLGYVVERVANQPFDAYCQQKIFAPLGMTQTEFRLAKTPLSELAIPYSPTITSAQPHYTFPDYPDGGLRTTVVDLSKFLRMLIQKGAFNGHQILQTATIDLMQQPTINLVRGSLSFEFGLGMYYTDVKGIRLYGHGGGEQGTSTSMSFNPKTGVGVIVFTNTTNANIDLIINTLYQYGIQ